MHATLKVSRRYAKSLLDLAAEKNQLPEVSKDVLFIQSVLKQNKDLEAMLHSPLIKADTKLTIVHKIFGDHIGKLTRMFVDIIIRKKRENILPGIVHSFVEQERAHRGYVLAEVTSAIALDTAQRDKIKKLVLSIYDKVDLEEHVNPDIIGGFSIKVGDKLYDETIASRITGIRNYYLTNPYFPKF